MRIESSCQTRGGNEGPDWAETLLRWQDTAFTSAGKCDNPCSATWQLQVYRRSDSRAASGFGLLMLLQASNFLSCRLPLISLHGASPPGPLLTFVPSSCYPSQTWTIPVDLLGNRLKTDFTLPRLVHLVSASSPFTTAYRPNFVLADGVAGCVALHSHEKHTAGLVPPAASVLILVLRRAI